MWGFVFSALGDQGPFLEINSSSLLVQRRLGRAILLPFLAFFACPKPIVRIFYCKNINVFVFFVFFLALWEGRERGPMLHTLPSARQNATNAKNAKNNCVFYSSTCEKLAWGMRKVQKHRSPLHTIPFQRAWSSVSSSFFLWNRLGTAVLLHSWSSECLVEQFFFILPLEWAWWSSSSSCSFRGRFVERFFFIFLLEEAR